MREMQKSFDGLNKMACFISIFSLLKIDVLVIDEISMLSPDMLHTWCFGNWRNINAFPWYAAHY